jgi:hypothetical protein
MDGERVDGSVAALDVHGAAGLAGADDELDGEGAGGGVPGVGAVGGGVEGGAIRHGGQAEVRVVGEVALGDERGAGAMPRELKDERVARLSDGQADTEIVGSVMVVSRYGRSGRRLVDQAIAGSSGSGSRPPIPTRSTLAPSGRVR